MTNLKNEDLTSMLSKMEDSFGDRDITIDGASRTVNLNDIGQLENTMAVVLHTTEAVKLYKGRMPSSDNQYGISGIAKFSSIFKAIEDQIKNDCPIADQYFYVAEQRIMELRNTIKVFSSHIQEEVNKNLPSNCVVTKKRSQNPLKITAHFASILGHKACYLLTDIDELFLELHTTRQAAFISKKMFDDIRKRIFTSYRALMEYPKHYRVSGATRDDFAANNPRAQAALERNKSFELDPEILRGDKRSDFAPDIYNHPTIETPSVVNEDNTEKNETGTDKSDTEISDSTEKKIA